MAKRILLFIMTNVLVMVTVSLIVNLLGVNHYLTAYGLNWVALAIFCGVWGMTGAFISLSMSRFIAKRAMGVEVLSPNSGHELVLMVAGLCQRAGLPMPEVGIYDSPEPNAFATGPSKRRSLVAVSSGLLASMNKPEIEGVLAHELSHISNGDMVTMTLIAGVVNSFAMFLSRIIGYFVSQAVREEAAALVRFAVTIALDILFTILGSIIVAYFSRAREYRADSGAAMLAGREQMIAALESLKRSYQPIDERGAALATLKISGKRSRMNLLASHPDLDSRIAALRNFQG